MVKNEKNGVIPLSGKKKQHTVKNNLLIDAACKILVLSPTYKGSRHDKRIADETVSFLLSGSYLYQDSGFIGFNPAGITVVQPKKKPKGGELTAAEKARTGKYRLSVSVLNMR